MKNLNAAMAHQSTLKAQTNTQPTLKKKNNPDEYNLNISGIFKCKYIKVIL
jgi:hypothetical protein